MRTNNRVCSHATHPDDGGPVIAICIECSLPWYMRDYGSIRIPAERPVREAVVLTDKFQNGLRNRPRRADGLVKHFVKMSVNRTNQRTRTSGFAYNQMMALAQGARRHVANKHEAIVVGYLRVFKRHPLGDKAVPTNPIFGGAA